MPVQICSHIPSFVKTGQFRSENNIMNTFKSLKILCLSNSGTYQSNKGIIWKTDWCKFGNLITESTLLTKFPENIHKLVNFILKGKPCLF